MIGDRRQSFVDLGSRPVNIGSLTEFEGHEGDRITRGGPHSDEMRYSTHANLDRRRHPAFELLGREARSAHRDEHLHGRHIRKGVDRQFGVGVQSPSNQGQRAEEGEKSLMQSGLDQSFEHGGAGYLSIAVSSESRVRMPRVATRSEAFSGARIEAYCGVSETTATETARKPLGERTNTQSLSR